MHVIKVGTQYVTADGSLSDAQAHALRMDLTGAIIRKVKLTPKKHDDDTPQQTADDMGGASI